MEGKEIIRGRREILDRRKCIKHDVITEQSSRISQGYIVGEQKVPDLKMRPES